MAPDDIIAMLRAGHSMRVPTTAVQKMAEMADAALAAKTILTLVGATAPKTMMQIAERGGGYVVWDVAG